MNFIGWLCVQSKYIHRAENTYRAGYSPGFLYGKYSCDSLRLFFYHRSYHIPRPENKKKKKERESTFNSTYEILCMVSIHLPAHILYVSPVLIAFTKKTKQPYTLC